MPTIYISHEERCVACGTAIPEGYQVCMQCLDKASKGAWRMRMEKAEKEKAKESASQDTCKRHEKEKGSVYDKLGRKISVGTVKA